MPGVLRAEAATPGWEEPGAVARRDLAERLSGTGIAAVERGRIHGGAGPVGALGTALQDRSVIAQLHGVLTADAWEPLRQRSPPGVRHRGRHGVPVLGDLDDRFDLALVVSTCPTCSEIRWFPTGTSMPPF